MSENHPPAPTGEFRVVAPGYGVSMDGRVWSCVKPGCKGRLADTWHELKPSPQHRGHMTVYLGRKKCRFVHRLVLEAFVGPCPPGLECLHGDDNPGNNRLENLRWGTSQENADDRARNKKPRKPERALTSAEVEELVHLVGSGVTGAEAGRRLNVAASTVYAIMRGAIWNAVTGFPKHRPIKGGPRGRKPKAIHQGKAADVAATPRAP